MLARIPVVSVLVWMAGNIGPHVSWPASSSSPPAQAERVDLTPLRKTQAAQVQDTHRTLRRQLGND